MYISDTMDFTLISAGISEIYSSWHFFQLENRKINNLHCRQSLMSQVLSALLFYLIFICWVVTQTLLMFILFECTEIQSAILPSVVKEVPIRFLSVSDVFQIVKMNISTITPFNTSWPSNTSDADFLPTKLQKSLAYGAVFLMSVIGNSFIIWAIRKDIRLKTTTNIFIGNMAVADLINIIFTTPIRVYEVHYTYEWVFDDGIAVALCKIVYFPPCFAFFVAMYSCLFIAFDRYYAVAHPLKAGFCKSRLKHILLGLWIFAVSFSWPFPYYMNIKMLNGKIYCLLDDIVLKSFMYAIFIIFLLPTIVITIIYMLIVYKLRRHKIPGHQNDSVRRRREQQNKKVLKMCVAIVASLFLTLVCVGVLAVLLVMRMDLSGVDLKFTCLFMLHVNSCYSFFICLIFNNNYRDNGKALLSKCFCCSNVIEPARGVVTITMNGFQ